MLEDLQKHLDEIMAEQNFKSIPAFEGYTPDDMNYILYDTFGDDSPIKLLDISEADYKEIPIMNQIKYLMLIIVDRGELKLTKKGFLPPKIIADIYKQGFIREEYIESEIVKVYKETDLVSMILTRVLSGLMGLTKKRNNKLSITKKGAKILKNDSELLLLILTTFVGKFNWAYLDYYNSKRIGQLGFGFSLILLQKYGNTKRSNSFYADKYFKAFPEALDEMDDDGYGTKEYSAANCYSLRTFDRFFKYFGFIEIRTKYDSLEDMYIIKTRVFDKLIKCIPYKLN